MNVKLGRGRPLELGITAHSTAAVRHKHDVPVRAEFFIEGGGRKGIPWWSKNIKQYRR